MQRGRLIGYKLGQITSQHLREHEGGGLPVGSDAARQAILEVQARLQEKQRKGISLHRSRFVEKTGYGDE